MSRWSSYLEHRPCDHVQGDHAKSATVSFRQFHRQRDRRYSGDDQPGNTASRSQDAIFAHEGQQAHKDVNTRILRLFTTVGLPGRIMNMYPHERSGGMKKRVCIAIAIALNPAIIIADESTSALDVVVQRLVAQTLLKVKQAPKATT